MRNCCMDYGDGNDKTVRTNTIDLSCAFKPFPRKDIQQAFIKTPFKKTSETDF